MGLQESAATNPELTGAVVEAFGADLPIAKTNDIARVCRKRVNEIKKFLESEQMVLGLSEMVTGMPSDMSQLPAMAVEQLMPPIMAKEPFHQQKVMWLGSLLDLDEMMDAPVILREAIGAMISKHIEMDSLNQIEMQQAASLAQLGGQVPQMMAQQMMGEAQMADQQAMGQQQMAQEQAMAQQQMMAEQDAEMMGREEDRADAERDHERQTELEAMKQVGALATRRVPAQAA